MMERDQGKHGSQSSREDGGAGREGRGEGSRGGNGWEMNGGTAAGEGWEWQSEM